MFLQSDPSVFWLNVTNAALGAVVLVCLGAVLWGVVLEVAAKVRHRAAATADDHLFVVPGLGVTMADGGEREDKPESES